MDTIFLQVTSLHLATAQIYETLSPLNGQVNHNTLAFIRRANIALDKWWADCDELHRALSPALTGSPVTPSSIGETMDEESLPRKILAGELYYAKLWLVCVALRGVSWDKMPFEQRELAFQAKDAASACLANLLDSPTYRAALRYAVHDTLVMAAFSGLFLLKMANLFPAELDLAAITIQVEQLAQLLSDVAAERSLRTGFLYEFDLRCLPAESDLEKLREIYPAELAKILPRRGRYSSSIGRVRRTRIGHGRSSGPRLASR